MKRFLITLILILFCFSYLTANIEFDRDTLIVVYENSMVYNGQLDTACVYVRNTSSTDTVSISMMFIIQPIIWIDSIIFNNWNIPPLDSAPVYLIIDTTGLMPDMYTGKLKVFSNSNNISLPLLLDLYTGGHSGVVNFLKTDDFLNKENSDIKEIIIYNINGQQMYKNNNNYINIKNISQNFPKGTYIMRIKTQNNIINKKYIKL